MESLLLLLRFCACRCRRPHAALVHMGRRGIILVLLKRFRRCLNPLEPPLLAVLGRGKWVRRPYIKLSMIVNI